MLVSPKSPPFSCPAPTLCHTFQSWQPQCFPVVYGQADGGLHAGFLIADTLSYFLPTLLLYEVPALDWLNLFMCICL